MDRKTAVAGYFYDDDKEKLESFILSHLSSNEKSRFIMAVAPHAGYVYSGSVAVETLSSLEFPKNIILMGTNHSGFGERIGVWADGEWETPFGNIKVNSEISQFIIDNSMAENDYLSHVREHSIEVLLPIIKYLKSDINIVPISMMGMGLDKLQEFSRVIVEACKKYNCAVIVSSDMNHYETEKVTTLKDKKVIENILKLDYEGVYNTVMNDSVSMCGVYPAIAGLMAAKELGAENGTLIRYSTSADYSHDTTSTVGYAGIIIK